MIGAKLKILAQPDVIQNALKTEIQTLTYNIKALQKQYFMNVVNDSDKGEQENFENWNGPEEINNLVWGLFGD